MDSKADRDSLFDAIEQQVEAEQGAFAWLRSRSTTRRVVMATLVSVMVPLVVLAATPRIDLSVFPSSRLALDLGLLLLVAAPVLWLCQRPLHRSQPARWWMPAAFSAALVLSIVVAGLPAAHALHSESLLGVGDDFLPRAAACFIFGLVCGAPIVVAMRLLDPAPLLRPTALVFGGLVGMIALQLHCPLVSSKHLFAGHASVVGLVVVLAGFVLWRRTR